MNIVFEYLYRDSGNYKKWGSIVFSNSEDHGVDAVRSSIRQAMPCGEYFDAQAVRLPDLHFSEFNAELDLPLHEFFDVNVSDQQPDDLYCRSIDEFIGEISRAGH
jgi:hypothetical protein